MVMNSEQNDQIRSLNFSTRSSIKFTNRKQNISQGIRLISLAVALLICGSGCLQEAGGSSSFSGEQAQVSLSLILPQSFRVPTNELQGERNSERLQQYVGLINNAQSEVEDEKLRLKYGKLSLQVRDARTPITGQLFHEHLFDYFPSWSQRTILLPVNLEQVSANLEAGVKQQQLIVSIRPHQLNSGFGSGSIEFASSPPISIEPVPSYDGRRSFAVLQTDKPIYRPEEVVRIRSLVVNEELRPVTGDELRLQIRNPQKIIVEEVRFPSSQLKRAEPDEQPLFLDHSFRFPPEPMLGSWSVHLLHADPIANDTTSFELKEYILPTFEVSFEPPKYILPSTVNISGAIVAKYHYGLPVQGKAYFKFGYKELASSKPKFIARSSIKSIDQSTGRVEFRMSAAKIQEMVWFPTIAYSKFVIEATVTETSTGQREVVQDSQCTFLPHPYHVSFEDSIEHFKPRLSQQLSVQLLELHTQRPPPEGARLFAEYLDQNGKQLKSSELNDKPQILDTEALTDAAGHATFRLGPLQPEVSSIQVSVRWLNSSAGSSAKPEELALGQHTLTRHESSLGWINIVNKNAVEFKVGEQFHSPLALQAAQVRAHELYFLVAARGNILLLDRLAEGPSVSFRLTEQMVPSARLLVLARSTTGGFLADSMRLKVKHDSLKNCLRMSFKSHSSSPENATLAAPNERGTLSVRARQGDLVSVVGVDAALYTVNNRSRVELGRILGRVRRLDAGCGFGGGRDDLDVLHNAGLLLAEGGAEQQAKSQQVAAYLGSSCLTVASQLRLLEDIQLGYSRPLFAAAGSQTKGPRILDSLSRNRLLLASAGQEAGSLRLRLKREVDVESLIRSQRDSFARSCCRLGTLEDIPQRRNCSARKRIVEKYMSHRFEPSPSKCSQVYFECCRAVFGDQVALGSIVPSPRAVDEEMVVGRKLTALEASSGPSSSNLNRGQLDRIEAETLVRRDFRETWLFELLEIREPDGRGSLEVQLPHSITSWSVSALALNKFQPICLMERPLKITSFREIFLQLSLPHRVIQGEQIDLVATIFNYSPRSLEVFVYLHGLEDLCSEAEPNERSELKRVRIERLSSQALLFPIIPLRVGKYPLKITAVTSSANGSDSVERELNVVQRGKVVTDETTFSLDPMNQQRRSKRAIQTGNLVDEIDSARGLQRSKVRLTPTRDAELIVPQSQECIVSAIGDALGQSVQTSILDVENLIRLPHGCGEQVMIYMGPTLYTAHYLQATDRLSGDLRWKALRYIQAGYKRILNFRKGEGEHAGAFSAFPRREPSVWLTSFVSKLLCQVERTAFLGQEVHVDRNVVNTALEWLLEQQESQTGAWTEVHPVYHQEMLGGILRENALTAFVALSLNECSHHSLDLVKEGELAPNAGPEELAAGPTSFQHAGHADATDRLRLATRKAEQMLLRDKYKALKERNPYVLALTAYALSFNNPKEAIEVLNSLMGLAERSHSKNQIHWRGDYNLETAAYALQAIIELGPLANQHLGAPANKIAPSPWQRGLDAIAISNWLSTRRSFTGAFESTQDTVVALEALSKFAQLQSTPNNNLLPPSSALNSSTAGEQAKLLCNVTLANNNRTRRSLEFRNDNAQVLQTFKMDSLDIDVLNGEMLDIVTSGNGLGMMSVKLKYNVFQEEDEYCRFDISSFIEEWKPPRMPSLQALAPDDLRPSPEQHSSGGQHSAPANNATDDDPFRPFDKTMLGELNVINMYQPDLLNPAQQAPTDGQHRNRKPVLRLRRSPERGSPELATAELRVASREEKQESSWTARLVSSLKENFAFWSRPASAPKTTPAPAPAHAPRVNLAAFQPPPTQPERALKANTSRRSPQAAPSPLPGPLPAGAHAPPPPSAHLNPLSNETIANPSNASDQMLAEQPQAQNANPKLMLLLKVCVNYLSTRRDSEMAVIEVGVLSGFKPNEADLAEITKEVGGLAMHVELSADKSMVVIYMKYIPSSGPYCLQFRLVRNTLVYNLQSGYIRAYEYYSPAHSCSNTYTPSRQTNLLETKCDSSGQVCECASKSLCPATRKLVDLAEVHSVNATSARTKLAELVCRKSFDLVSMVRLSSVRYLESGKVFRLAVKVVGGADLRGNLSRIMDVQRAQKSRGARKWRQFGQEGALGNGSLAELEPETEESSLDLLSLSVDSACVHDDPLLLHLAHPNQWRQGGQMMILFARSQKLEKRFLRVSGRKEVRTGSSPSKPALSPKPPAADQENPQDLASLFEEAQQYQYFLNLKLDRDSIIHDLGYQGHLAPRDAINNLLLGLELKHRQENWSCPEKL